MWQALASVLHMSNVTFDAKDHEQGEVAAVKDPGVRAVAADNGSFCFSARLQGSSISCHFFLFVFSLYGKLVLASPAHRLSTAVELEGVTTAAGNYFERI